MLLNPFTFSHVGLAWRLRTFGHNFCLLHKEIKVFLRHMGILPKCKPMTKEQKQELILMLKDMMDSLKAATVVVHNAEEHKRIKKEWEELE